MDYESQLKQSLNEAQKRVEQSVAAIDFPGTPQGKLIQDWINERVSYLLSKLTEKDPATDREYLSLHGAIRELQDFNAMLQSKANGLERAREDAEDIQRQLTPSA